MRTNTLIRLKGPDLPMNAHFSASTASHTQSHPHSLTRLHLTGKNTNTVVRMTRAYCINQKNPQETYVEHR